jgi:hypothetical protein
MPERTHRIDCTPYPFEPSGGASRACTTATANVILGGTGEQVAVTNYGSVPAFIAFGADNTVVATISDFCVLPNSQVYLTLPDGSAYVAGITASGTTTIQVETGWGT